MFKYCLAIRLVSYVAYDWTEKEDAELVAVILSYFNRSAKVLTDRYSRKFVVNNCDDDRFPSTPRTVLQNISRLSYDNVKVTINLRRTSNLQNILRRAQFFS